MSGDGESPTETVRETFQRRLFAARRDAGLTQEALAARVQALGGSLHPTAITRIEKGRRDVSLEEVLLLAAAIEVSPRTLFEPDRQVDRVRLTPAGDAHPAERVRDWLRDLAPLADTDRPTVHLPTAHDMFESSLQKLNERIDALERERGPREGWLDAQ